MAIEDGDHYENEHINFENPVNNPGTFDLHRPIQRLFKIKNQSAREFFGEVFSTFFLLTFICGSAAQMKLNNENPDTNKTNMPVLTAYIGSSFCVMLGVLVGGKSSGAHMNPAVSLAMLLTGRMTPFRFIVYILGQAIGAFMGAVCVFVIYLDALKRYADRHGHTYNDQDMAGIFATYPTPGLSIFGALIDQFFGTAFLVIVVLAITDKKNVEMPHGTVAILISLTVLMINVAFAHNCGAAINPIRDIMPRIFTSLAGWGTNPFIWGNSYFWVPIVGPLVGSVFGTIMYIIFISNNWP